MLYYMTIYLFNEFGSFLIDILSFDIFATIIIINNPEILDINSGYIKINIEVLRELDSAISRPVFPRKASIDTMNTNDRIIIIDRLILPPIIVDTKTSTAIKIENNENSL